MQKILRWIRLTGVAVCLSAVTFSPVSADQTSHDVLVLGGTGKVGARVVRALVEDGHQVTVFLRTTSDRSRIKDLPVDYVVGDLMNDADISAALSGRQFNIIVSAVRVKSENIHFYGTFMKPLTDHARAIGVKQIIHHSAVGAGSNLERFAGRGWEENPGLVERLEDQGAGEEILRASGIPYTIIRNAGIYPDEEPSTGTAELTEDDTVLTSMTRADLALLTMQCFDNVSCYNKTYHVRDSARPWRAPQRGQDSG